MEIKPQILKGNWSEGYALDLHTVSSILFDNGSGNIAWDTKRTSIGEELYLLKYHQDLTKVTSLSKMAADFLMLYVEKWQLNLVIPIPPSDFDRKIQPVYELAKELSKLTNIPVRFDILKKVKKTDQLKNIEEPSERRKILKDAFDIKENVLESKNVLLFDDLYRSGETMNAIADILIKKGKAKNVFVLTITKTRSKK